MTISGHPASGGTYGSGLKDMPPGKSKVRYNL